MIHSTAIISPEAKLGSNVSIGPYSIIYPNVIGDNTTIGSHCEIGHPTPLAQGVPLTLGAGSLIRSHSIFYEGSTFGEKLVTGHRVTAREATRAGVNFQIGTLCDIQGHCSIGDYVRFHSNVHIGQHSTIGNFVWIFPYVVLTNDPHPPSEVMSGATVQDYAAIATMSILLPGVTVGKGALVGAQLGQPGCRSGYRGRRQPGQVHCETSKVKLKDGSGNAAYPWRKHFHRGYPEEVVTAWLNEFSPPASN